MGLKSLWHMRPSLFLLEINKYLDKYLQINITVNVVRYKCERGAKNSAWSNTAMLWQAGVITM